MRKDPNAERFFFVVYPYIDSEAKAAEVIKNTLTTDSFVYTSNKDDNERPIKPEYM